LYEALRDRVPAATAAAKISVAAGPQFYLDPEVAIAAAAAAAAANGVSSMTVQERSISSHHRFGSEDAAVPAAVLTKRASIERTDVFEVGSKGSGKLQFDCPAGLALSVDQTLLLAADFSNHRVAVLSASDGAWRGELKVRCRDFLYSSLCLFLCCNCV
jgi:hypothetical protein